MKLGAVTTSEIKMSRRSKKLHSAWTTANLLKGNQLVRWTKVNLPKDGDYGDIIDRPCLVEIVNDWDKEEYTNSSHQLATVHNVDSKKNGPHLQFYTKLGDKDELLMEPSIDDIYLFPANGSTVTLADGSQGTLSFDQGSLSFEITVQDESAAKTKTKPKAKPKRKAAASSVKKPAVKKAKTKTGTHSSYTSTNLISTCILFVCSQVKVKKAKQKLMQKKTKKKTKKQAKKRGKHPKSETKKKIWMPARLAVRNHPLSSLWMQ